MVKKGVHHHIVKNKKPPLIGGFILYIIFGYLKNMCIFVPQINQV